MVVSPETVWWFILGYGLALMVIYRVIMVGASLPRGKAPPPIAPQEPEDTSWAPPLVREDSDPSDALTSRQLRAQALEEWDREYDRLTAKESDDRPC